MKRIVLTTSDIQRANLLDGTWIYKSTGLLERVVAEGFEVFVVTIRTKFVETDNWWKELVPDDHIFLAEPEGDDLQEHLASGWQKCITALGLTWPTNGDLKPTLKERLGSDWASQPGRWDGVHHWLSSQGVDTKFSLNK